MAQAEKAHTRTASTDHRTTWSWKRLFGKDDGNAVRSPPPQEDDQRPGIARRLSRKVVPGLPRAGTFKRQQSERRDRLEPNKPNVEERRTLSVDRRNNPSVRVSSSPTTNSPRLSAPELLETSEKIDSVLDTIKDQRLSFQQGQRRDHGAVSKDRSNIYAQSVSTEAFDEMILEDLKRRWILNLSMHFRDKSKREKFFVSFAETPTHWRRVTVSLDYRNAPFGSLEEELQRTRFQRDKSARIYEAIRESLQDIQFYETVTNLKLQTENERLHVHVVEDLSEIISFPPVRAISHLNCPGFREDELAFDSHLSGFVYKVKVDGQVFIKKEIPGPDTVDEFLYEINALHQLSGSKSVIQFGGVVLDKKGEVVKGLLISFAAQGALIEVIYDGEGTISWKRRERWAKQIVQGLSEIHEAGFVQGDFTLSNIVIDEYDNAKIIDINRRGCPVGWEPPEVAALIESSQRISMYIGVKSDLYQLGMVLYALATQQDEPESHRPLNLGSFPPEVPGYYFDVCQRCLNDNPRYRSQAAFLSTLFPDDEDDSVFGGPSPIIVDVLPADEEAFSLTYPDRYENMQLARPLTARRGTLSPTRSQTTTEVSDQSDYPRRGRSPPPKYEMPDLPFRSNAESDYLGTFTGETLAEDEHVEALTTAFEAFAVPNSEDLALQIPLPPSEKGSVHLENSREASPVEGELLQSQLTAFRVGLPEFEKDPSDIPLPSSTGSDYHGHHEPLGDLAPPEDEKRNKESEKEHNFTPAPVDSPPEQSIEPETGQKPQTTPGASIEDWPRKTADAAVAEPTEPHSSPSPSKLTTKSPTRTNTTTAFFGDLAGVGTHFDIPQVYIDDDLMMTNRQQSILTNDEHESRNNPLHHHNLHHHDHDGDSKDRFGLGNEATSRTQSGCVSVSFA